MLSKRHNEEGKKTGAFRSMNKHRLKSPVTILVKQVLYGPHLRSRPDKSTKSFPQRSHSSPHSPMGNIPGFVSQPVKAESANQSQKRSEQMTSVRRQSGLEDVILEINTRRHLHLPAICCGPDKMQHKPRQISLERLDPCCRQPPGFDYVQASADKLDH
ncbi:hypothetical protein BDV19DRAFT_180891 [Aspergillus venezuelensis]